MIYQICFAGRGYYLFDPTDHEDDGLPWKGIQGKGKSAVMRFQTSDRLVDMVHNNIDKFENSSFLIAPCTILRKQEVTTEYPQCLEEEEYVEIMEKGNLAYKIKNLIIVCDVFKYFFLQSQK